MENAENDNEVLEICENIPDSEPISIEVTKWLDMDKHNRDFEMLNENELVQSLLTKDLLKVK